MGLVISYRVLVTTFFLFLVAMLLARYDSKYGLSL